jgi:hypothetical protein
VSWVCLGSDAGCVLEEAEPKAFKFRALTGDGMEYGRTLSESKVASCIHAQPCCCGDWRCGVLRPKPPWCYDCVCEYAMHYA